jgi:hypothetical protein
VGERTLARRLLPYFAPGMLVTAGLIRARREARNS